MASARMCCANSRRRLAMAVVEQSESLPSISWDIYQSHKLPSLRFAAAPDFLDLRRSTNLSAAEKHTAPFGSPPRFAVSSRSALTVAIAEHVHQCIGDLGGELAELVERDEGARVGRKDAFGTIVGSAPGIGKTERSPATPDGPCSDQGRSLTNRRWSNEIESD